MESLESFIKKRMNQSAHMAMMIPRYLENPDRFVGKKQYTFEQALDFKKEALKCKATLVFLEQYKKATK